MILYLEGSVGPRMFEKLAWGYSQLKKKDRLNLYLNSPGGNMTECEMITQLIEDNRDRTVLNCAGEICSAALHIAIRVSCPRNLFPDLVGLAHIPRIWTLSTAKGLADGQEFTGMYLRDKTQLKNFIDVYKPILTETQWKTFSEGHDLYLNNKDLVNLFKKQTKIQNEYFKNLNEEYA